MLKKAVNTIFNWMPDVLLIILFSIWVNGFIDTNEKYGSIKENEYILYAMLAIITFRFYSRIVKCIRKNSTKYLITGGTATIFTIAVWLLNSYWLYVETNNRLPL